MPRKGNSTRTEILDAAMTMFVEQGYDKTSLREIAEACGVTKAALYYHFRTKDDIVRSALDSYVESMRGVLDWLGGLPPSPERDVELIDRLLGIFAGRGARALRFVQANPTVFARDDFGERHVDYIRTLVAGIAGADPTADAVLRATMGVGALVMSAMPDPPIGSQVDAESRKTAGRALALEILAPLSASHAG